jgi:energy-coupling factor transporter transmembrane protein EcfT
LIRSFERAERMHYAMLSRGYSGDFPVVSPRRFTWRDLAFVSAVALFVTLTFFVRGFAPA